MELKRYFQQVWLGAIARSSGDYWERRYHAGLNSGAGSYGRLAEFKARVLNSFVASNDVSSVIELGCGDGNQLTMGKYPRYLGIDVSKTAIALCAKRFAQDSSKSFLWYDPQHSANLANFIAADLTLSLDVVYHLLEDDVYQRHLDDLFSMSRRFVIVYSSDRVERHPAAHVRHREFTGDVRDRFPEFRLMERLSNPYPEETFADFFIFQRNGR